MASKELVVTTVDEDDLRLVVIIRRSFQDHPIDLLNIDHGKLQHPFVASTKRPSDDRPLERPIEEFYSPDPTTPTSLIFLQNVYFVTEGKDGALFSAVV